MFQHTTRLRGAFRVLLLCIVASSAFTILGSLRPVYAQGPQAAPPFSPATKTGDANGSVTGAAADVADGGGNAFVPTDPTALAAYNKEAKAEPLAVQLASTVGQNRIAINIVWTLVTGYLVMFMQAGFAMVETGFCRKKNAAHVFMTNFMIYPLGMLGFWICGFAFMFGSEGSGSTGFANLGGTQAISAGAPNDFHNLIGTHGFFLQGGYYDVGIFALFLFQMVFMDTTATIPTGAMAERWKFGAFMVYGFFVSMIDYPIYGHWVWGGGWLAALGLTMHWGHGAVDFAGSGVVHAIGGWTALAGSLVLGPRIGKFIEGKPQPMPGHNLPMALVGCFILAFGWFGFNPGSTLGASGAGNLRIAIIAVNTMLASATGALVACAYWWARFGKPDPSMCCNGMLAGLVAITAPCAFIDSGGAAAVGAIAGLVVCLSVPFFENMGIDDPVGAISVHGVCGIWGVLSVGIFADGTYGAGWGNVGATKYMGVAGQGVTGAIYGDWGQLIAQTVDSVVNIAWAFGISFIFFKIQDAIMGIRSSKEDELMGLDLPEMGAMAYPEDAVMEMEPELAG